MHRFGYMNSCRSMGDGVMNLRDQSSAYDGMHRVDVPNIKLGGTAGSL